MSLNGYTGSKTADLLVLLCRDELTAEEMARADMFAEEVDNWDFFADLARRNGVAAQVWFNLSQCGCVTLVPLAVSTFLEGAMQKTIARVGFISARAASITTLLETAGIRVILLKGLALEHTVYGGRGLRQMSDADILVRPEQAVVAWELLKKEGYISRPAKSVFHERIMMQLGNHLPELHRDGISVDVHHRLFHNEGRDLTGESFSEAEEVDVSGVKCHVLPPRTAFLSMVKHLSKHDIKGEFQVRLFTDMFLMIKHYRDDVLCSRLVDEAEKAKVLKECERVLFILSRFWGVNVPEYFTGRLTCEQRDAYSEWFIDGVYAAGTTAKGKGSNVYADIVSGIDTFHHKLLFLMGDMFPSAGFMRERYGLQSSLAVILRYPLRLGKIIWFIRALFKSH